MSNWVSIGGKWFPANEKVFIPGDGENGNVGQIYEGPDRVAVSELEAAGLTKDDYLGSSYKENEETLEKARKLGYNTIDEYLKSKNIDMKVVMEKQKKNLDENIVTHKESKRKQGIRIVGGGANFAKDSQISAREGDFGVPDELAGKVR